MTIRNSASLILINSFYNTIVKQFDIIFLQRVSKSKSFADKVVFPGGVLDQCDLDDKWMEIINQRFSPDQIKKIVCENELTIYNKSKSLSTMIPQIFYRICAIRETFEETGILLAIDKSNKSILSNQTMLEDIKVNNWQKKVSENGNEFFELFQSYHLVPDLLSLYEWAEWLTPNIFKNRFHTIFFMLFIEQELKTTINDDESTSLIWKSPSEAYEEFLKTNQLAPPQMSELFDLSCLCSLDRIRNEAIKRQRLGGFQNLQNGFTLSDATIYALPGDSRFVTNVQETNDFSHLSIKDFSNDKHVRRFIHKDGKFSYHSNHFQN